MDKEASQVEMGQLTLVVIPKGSHVSTEHYVQLIEKLGTERDPVIILVCSEDEISGLLREHLPSLVGDKDIRVRRFSLPMGPGGESLAETRGELEGDTDESDSQKPLPLRSREEMTTDALRAGMKKASEVSRRERGIREPTVVGMCPYCGHDVISRQEMAPIPIMQMRVGGPNPMVDVTACSSPLCGETFGSQRTLSSIIVKSDYPKDVALQTRVRLFIPTGPSSSLLYPCGGELEPMTPVTLGVPVTRVFDHRDQLAFPVEIDGRAYFILNKELQ